MCWHSSGQMSFPSPTLLTCACAHSHPDPDRRAGVAWKEGLRGWFPRKQEEKSLGPTWGPKLGRGIQTELCLHAHVCESDRADPSPDPSPDPPDL